MAFVMSSAVGLSILSFCILISAGYVSCSHQESEYQSRIGIKTLVDPSENVSLPLIEKEEITHNSRRFRFGLPSPNHVLGVPTGQHVKLGAVVNGEYVSHSYTPISSDNDFGYADFVIKIYFKNVDPKYPAGGRLTQYIDSMKIGDTINFRGPLGRIKYLGHGNFSIKFTRKDVEPTMVYADKLVMIAGGTGIAPMLQLIRNITHNAEDDTKLSLLFSNRSEDDILLRNELDKLAKEYEDRFKLWYTVDKPKTKDWKFSTGYVNQEMIASHLYPPANTTLVLLCGPPPMIDVACLPALDKLGYSRQLVYIY